jgi:hypothetical protein
MMRTRIAGKVLAMAMAATGLLACYAQAQVGGGTEECRTVEVRNRHDVEVCVSRCSDEGCRTHCSEQERWSRQHRCWVD